MKFISRLGVAAAAMAVSGSLWASGLASAASAPGGLGAVTVTVTPTIQVSKDADGNLVTIGTVIPSSSNAVSSGGDGSSNVLLWTILGLLALLIIGALAWWLATRNKGFQVGTHREAGAATTDPSPTVRNPERGGATAVSEIDRGVEPGETSDPDLTTDELDEGDAGRQQR